ncbi:MAG: hypothetical protein IBX57_09940 [Gammaproteobacteria bacterium]|nr:hypothetical protein [Gammaproteobacteria bacterium]
MAELSTDNASELIQFDGRESAQSIALQLAQHARREICFFGQSIDPVLFDNMTMVDCLSEFARRNNKTIIKFVVDSTQHNVATGHRLLPLAQRLTSSIHIHLTAPQHKNANQMFMLVDDSGYLYCPNRLRYQGKACLHDVMTARNLKQDFSEIWNHSSVDINARQIHI